MRQKQKDTRVTYCVALGRNSGLPRRRDVNFAEEKGFDVRDLSPTCASVSAFGGDIAYVRYISCTRSQPSYAPELFHLPLHFSYAPQVFWNGEGALRPT